MVAGSLPPAMQPAITKLNETWKSVLRRRKYDFHTVCRYVHCSWSTLLANINRLKLCMFHTRALRNNAASGGFGYALCAVLYSRFRASWLYINTLRTGLLNCLNARSRDLTFRHRASCIEEQAFRFSPQNAFYIFNQQIYFIIWYLLYGASLI